MLTKLPAPNFFRALIIFLFTILLNNHSSLAQVKLETEKAELKGTNVVFDYQNYPKERETFYHYFLAMFGQNKFHPIQDGEIGLYFYDLNDDGEKEILVYLRNPMYCGSLGCHFEIFKNFGDFGVLGMKIDTSNVIVPEEMQILDSKTLGYHDLLFSAARGWTRPAIWKWDGKRYDFYKKIEY